MKRKTAQSITLIICVSAMITLMPVRAQAASQSTIRAYNIGGQALLTLLRGVIEGNIKSLKDAGKMLLYGGASGYGFYQAKRMIGDGHVTTGLLLANLSASVSENVARGHHPLAYIGYSLGPARIQVATPFARNPRSVINLSLTTSDVLAFIYTLKYADSVSFKNGLLSFTSDETIGANVLGWTRGIYPTVLRGQSDYVYHHEAVHVAQHLQMMSISPEPYLNNQHHDAKQKPSLFSFSGIRLNLVGAVSDLAFSKLQNYDSQWFEIEAYHFAKPLAQ